jgi:tetratricopeptide (TPR) repeat protein
LGRHLLFSILIDGADVGREVRTEFFEEGSGATERVIISHLVKNEKMGSVLFQSTNVRIERTDAASGALVSTSFIKKDQVNLSSVSIAQSAKGPVRTISSISPFTGPSEEKKDILPLSGDEIIGFRMGDLLKKRAKNGSKDPLEITFFEAQLNAPVTLEISPPIDSTVSLDGQDIDGTWLEIRNLGSNQIIARSFFDNKGDLWVEEYPELHESRHRMTDPLSLPSETSELIVGLRSKTYIYDPSTATRATYELTATPDRLDGLSMLSDPLNHTLERVSKDKLVLEVVSGSPDQDEPPKAEDLGSSLYVKPKDPSIVQALRYLRSAGKRGSLSDQRKLNATPVIGRASLIQKPKAFWASPDKVAGLIMRYVGALLPDKRHTFSMADAVTTLERGGGDCTEHAVLFASLMRAHGIPTRLVTGMFLTRGGIWAYHMWNAFWDGESWHSIDPSTMTYRTGALHVALGRGASLFSDVRDRLADFMWRTFSGVSFDLVSASNNGEKLFLARPNSVDQDLSETSLFNAVVLSERGDHAGALDLLDKNIPKDTRSLSVKLMRIDLLFNAGRDDQALKEIASLRKETSSYQNTALLDKLELKCLLKVGRPDDAKALHQKISSRIKDDAVALAALNAEYLFGLGKEQDAISLLRKKLSHHGQDSSLLASFSDLVSRADSDSLDRALLDRALNAAWESVRRSWYVEHDKLATLSRLLFRTDHPLFSEWLLDHALVLAPKEPSLHSLREDLSSESRCRRSRERD